MSDRAEPVEESKDPAPPEDGEKAEQPLLPDQTKVVKEWKHSSPFISCRFDPRGRYVFGGAQDSSVQRFELASGQQAALIGQESWIRGLAFDPTGETLVTGGFDGRLVWWPATAEKPEPLRRIVAHEGWVRAVAVSPDGALVASCGNDHLVKLWSLADGQPVAELRGHSSHVYNVLFHPGGDDLVTADLKGVVKHWEVKGGKLVRDLDASALHKYDGGFRADIGGARCMTFDAGGTRLGCGGITGVTNAFAGVGHPLVVVFDWESGKATERHTSKDKLKGVAWGFCFHPQGFRVGAVGGSSGGHLLFWRAGEAQEFFKLKLPNTARDLDLHPDRLQLATAHYDSRIRLARLGAAT